MQEKEKPFGTIRINGEVAAICASNVLMRTKGVYRLYGGIMENFRSSQSQGIKISRDEDDITIDISLIVDYDVNIPQVAWNIQVDVKKEVEHITGLKVRAVNIHIQGVKTPDEEETNDKKRSKG